MSPKQLYSRSKWRHSTRIVYTTCSKIFFVLRCKDVPEAQRKALALRILTGEYPSDPEFKWTADPEQQFGFCIAALVALSHMHIDDASLLSFLEENLPKWEQLTQPVADAELPADIS